MKYVISILILLLSSPGLTTTCLFDDSHQNEAPEHQIPSTEKTCDLGDLPLTEDTPICEPAIQSDTDDFDFNKTHRFKYKKPRFIYN